MLIMMKMMVMIPVFPQDYHGGSGGGRDIGLHCAEVVVTET